MIKIFTKKSKLDKLNKQYNRLMEQGYKLSAVNRRASDDKYTEANRLMEEIQRLEMAGK